MLKTLETKRKNVFLLLNIYWIINVLFNLLNVTLYIYIIPFSPTLLSFVNRSHLDVSQILFTFVKLKL